MKKSVEDMRTEFAGALNAVREGTQSAARGRNYSFTYTAPSSGISKFKESIAEHEAFTPYLLGFSQSSGKLGVVFKTVPPKSLREILRTLATEAGVIRPDLGDSDIATTVL